jgi:hypothetical protein
MIRPVTLVCWILALSAGLYLYRAKHDVELMDQHIDQIAKQTADLRIESRGLLDEWIRLGEPEQLHRYSDEYLGLQPISPGQFARLSDLPARLPPTQPDPSDEQVDVVAQSSVATPAAVASPDSQSSGNQEGAAQSDAAAALAANPDRKDVAGTDEIPIPPIPPASIPVASSGASTAPALPLQARPVTPRLADGPADAASARPHPGMSPSGTDELPVATARVTPTVPAEPRQGPPGPINNQASGKSGAQAHGLPPLQAQASGDVSGLPPLQSQAQAREVAEGPGRISAESQGLGRASGQAPGPRPQESRTAENRVTAPPRESHPIESQQARGSGTQYGRQGPADAEPAHTGQFQTAPMQGGSLLGMSRGSVPLPLPAPTPVNANWSGPTGTVLPGSGR